MFIEFIAELTNERSPDPFEVIVQTNVDSADVEILGVYFCDDLREYEYNAEEAADFNNKALKHYERATS